ncbi:FAD-dependent oxidoreductase [Acuticoccus sp.]|uniref:FAD-dependent oxidoreductase n=1 Tax=Acuticoccus sp. TaxID=1904378 RepID=UPI003B5194FD
MSTERPRIVIAGAGHAALVALDRLAGAADGARLTLVTEGTHAHYSGMVPGWIEGIYEAASMSIPLAPFASRAGVELVEGRIVGANEEELRLADGRRVAYDALVVNAGSVAARPGPLADPRVIAGKPFDAMMAGLEPTLGTATSFAVVGAGVAGIEVTLALAARRPDAAIALVERQADLLAGLPAGVGRRVRRRLVEAGVALRLGRKVAAVHADALELTDGHTVPADAVLAFTGPAPPEWLARTPFARTADGYLATDSALRSTSHSRVLAVGDAATRVDDPRPKAGVFSVRSGPPLADAIAALARGHPPTPVRLQRRGLILLSTGDRRAIGTRNGLLVEGRWVWRLKDRFDRAFVDRFRLP